MINKNISIWRGSEAPPTLNHIWVKEGAILIYINDEWKPISDPELLMKLEKYVSNSLEEQTNEINKNIDELKKHTDDLFKENEIIKSIDLSDVSSLTNIYNNINNQPIYRLINYNSNSNYPVLEETCLKNNQLCYFERMSEIENISFLNTIEFNTKYYHLLFTNNHGDFSFAITETSNGLINKYPCLSNSLLWRFIGSPDCFILQSKSNKYLKVVGNNQLCVALENKKEATFFKLIAAENIDKFYIKHYDQSLYLNPLGGASSGGRVGTWSDPSDTNSMIKILDLNKYYKSNELTNYWYNIYFTNSKSYLCVDDNKIKASLDKKDKWLFIPYENKIYIRHEHGLYLLVNGQDLVLSELGHLFSINIITSNNNEFFYQIASNDTLGIDVNNGVISFYNLYKSNFTENTKCQLELVNHDDILKCVSLNDPHPLYYRIPLPTATLELL